MVTNTLKINLFNNVIVKTLIVFMFIFAFPIFPFINSNKLVLIISFLILLSNKSYQHNFFKIIFSKKIIFYILIISLFSLYTLFLTIVKAEYDFSLFLKQFSSIFLTVLTFMFFIVIDSKKLDRLIILAFVLQSVLIILSIISAEFYDFTSNFRLPISTQHIESYGSFRGNAISNYQFFGIGVMYGFVIIYFVVNRNLTHVKNLFVLILLTIVGVISSRFVITAVIIAFLYWFFYVSSIKKKIRFIFYFILFSFIAFAILKYTYSNYLSEKNVRVINYQILLPINNFIENGKLNASSVNRLHNMYETVNFNNVFFGDGRYINKTGIGYYGNVDPGYLRMTYYYGVFGLLLLIFIQMFLIFNLVKINRNNIGMLICFYIYFLALNLKGDIFYYSNNVIPILVGLIYFKEYEICGN